MVSRWNDARSQGRSTDNVERSHTSQRFIISDSDNAFGDNLGDVEISLSTTVTIGEAATLGLWPLETEAEAGRRWNRRLWVAGRTGQLWNREHTALKLDGFFGVSIVKGIVLVTWFWLDKIDGGKSFLCEFVTKRVFVMWKCRCARGQWLDSFH